MSKRAMIASKLDSSVRFGGLVLFAVVLVLGIADGVYRAVGSEETATDGVKDENSHIRNDDLLLCNYMNERIHTA
jgi:hypothetical protein